MFYIGTIGLFLGALFSALIPRGRKLGLALSAISCLALLAFSSITLYTNEATTIAAYNILPSLQFSFFIDRLAAFFILIISIVSLSVSIYSSGYAEHYQSPVKKDLLVSLMLVFILSMILVVSSKNMFSFIFSWEIMALSSFILVMFEYEKKDTRKAGFFYFIMTHLSTVFLLTAFIMIYSATGSFEITQLPAQSKLFTEVLFALLFIGFGIKAGVVPFHMWLPYAHPASPSNISALMSGVMIKVAIYGMMRFFLFVLVPELSWGFVIFTIGLLSAIIGIIYAFKDNDLKRMLAFSSIENIGIILVGFGMYIIFNAYGFPEVAVLGMAGALIHVFNHALFKSLLFLTTGSVANATGTKNIEEMGGLVKTMPYTAALFFVGAISISALPPLNGFVSEFIIFRAFMASFSLNSHILIVVMIAALFIFALTSALAASCFVKAFGTAFLAVPRTEEARNAKEAPASMLIGAGILAAACIVFGVFSYQILSALGYSNIIPNFMAIDIMLIAALGISFAAIRFSASQDTRIGETWGCGILSQNSKMEYTSSGFAGPITTILSPIYKTRKISEKSFYDKFESIFKEGSASISLMKFFEDNLYMPVARKIDSFSLKVAKLQQSGLDSYMLYSFVTIVLLLMIAGAIA